MSFKLFQYIKFLSQIILKKKTTIILPIIFLALAIVSSITIASLNLQQNYYLISKYFYGFLMLIFTVLFGSLKALNIYKDLENEGIDLITLSKPISRKSIFLGKLITFYLFNLLWSLLIFVCSAIFLASLNKSDFDITYLFLSFLISFFSFAIFGLITSLIAFKFNSKIAMTAPLAIIAPLTLSGSFISSNSTPSNNNIAYYLNSKYQYHKSGNESDTEKFYLKNGKDAFFIIPNGYQNAGFSNNQKSYIEKSVALSKNSAKEWQIFSWLSLPYQLVDILNTENKDVFGSLNTLKESNLDQYINYSNLESNIYSYKLNKKPEIIKLETLAVLKGAKEQSYIVPGMLKNESQIENLVNTDIIFARENADNFDISFPEDEFVYASPNDLVGSLKWTFMKEILNDAVFVSEATKLIEKTVKETHSITDELQIKSKFITNIQNYINNENSLLNLYENKEIAIFDPFALKERKISSLTEKKVYLASAFLYYLYFSNNDSKLLRATLKNERIRDAYEPSIFKIQIGEFNYQIGGYASYEKIQKVQDQKVVIRYNLKPSNNFLFQKVKEVYSIQRDTKVVNKNLYVLLWITLALILTISNTYIYTRKDYK